MLNSLRTRLWFSYALVIFVALGIVGVFSLLYIARNPTQAIMTRLRLQSVTETIKQRQSDFAGLRPLQVHNALMRASSIYKVRFLLVDSSYHISFDTGSGSQAPLRIEQLDIRKLGNSEPIQVETIEDINGDVWFFTILNLNQGVWLITATPRPETGLLAALRSRGDDVFDMLRRAGVIALLLSLGVSIWVAHWIAKPIKQLADEVRQAEKGDFRPIPPQGPKEVRVLTDTFNQMLGRVNNSQRAMRDFIANVSHDLKTPITSIQGFSQAILDGTASTPQEVQSSARIIYDESNRMRRMVDDLLELARFDAGAIQLKREKVDIVSILESIIEKLTPQAQNKNIKINMTKSQLPYILGDGDRLAQVFGNLIENAIQYSPTDGDIFVEVELASTEDGITVRVKDQGPGIPPEDTQRIFERFYRVDKSRSAGESKGSGLGLAIAKEIVDLHGGKISVQSEINRGSVFTVKLPFARPDDSTLVSKA